MNIRHRIPVFDAKMQTAKQLTVIALAGSIAADGDGASRQLPFKG
jgi:hypothetical protein